MVLPIEEEKSVEPSVSAEGSGEVAPEEKVEQPSSDPVKADPLVEEKSAGAGAHGIEVENSGYKVNPTFRSFGEEKKFDDWVLPFIKDADTEQKVRDLFQAKHSIERVKAKRDEYQAQLSELVPKHAELEGTVTRAINYLQNRDMASFQREVGIPDELILLRAKQIFDQQANPALRQQEEIQYSERKRIEALEQQNSQLSQTATHYAVQQRMFELDQKLSSPEVGEVSKAFDERAGRVGAFRDEIIRRGQYYAATSGEDRTVDQLLSELMPFVGVSSQNPAAVSAQPHRAPIQTAIVQEKRAVIPSVSGRGTSPAKKVIKSLDDIRAISASMRER